MTSPNVTTTITIKGKDDATAELRNVSKSLDKTAASMRAAGDAGDAMTRRVDAVASKSGKLSTVLSGVSDFAGHAEGKVRMLGDAAGLLDDTLTFLPGPIGIVGAALAGLTTVVALQKLEADRLSAALFRAFPPALAAQIREVATATGISREAAVELGQALVDSGRSADSVRDQIQAVTAEATALGSDGSQAVSAFARSLTAGVDAAARLVNKLNAVGVAIKDVRLASVASESFGGGAFAADAARADAAAQERLTALQQRLAEQERARQAVARGDAGELAALRARRGYLDAISAAMDKRSAAGDRAAVAAARDREALARYDEQIANTRDEIEGLGRARERAAQSLREAARVERDAIQADAAAELAAADAARAEQARRDAEAEERRRRAEQRAAGQAARARREREAAEARRRADDEIRLSQARADAYATMGARILAVDAQLATDPMAAAAVEQRRIAFELERDLAKIRSSTLLDAAAQEALITAERLAAQQAIAAASTAAADAVVAGLEREAQAREQARAAIVAQGEAWAGVGRQLAGALFEADAAKRVSAGLDAALETARGVAAVGAGNIPGAASHFIAAGLFAAQAVGAGGGGAGSASAAAAAPRAQPAPAAAATTGSATSSTTIHLHGIATSKAEVGAGVAKALKAAKGTGFLPAGVPA